MKKTISLVLAVVCFMSARAQKMTIEEYIARYKDLAMDEMRRTGVPAAVKLAQGIHETESGNSDLVKRSNNHFGIKCKTGWTGESVSHDDDALGECFRKYPTAEDSYRDHSDFLKRSARYQFLFNLKPTDYKGWAHGLKRAGYATNPRYPLIIIKYIEEHNLQEYTNIVLQGNVNKADLAKADDRPAVADAPDSTVESPALTEQEEEERVSETRTGKTLFNGLRAAWVRSGTSLLAIATEHRIALSRLLEFNDLEHDGLLVNDEWLYLERKRKAAKIPSYVTGVEETPRSVAQLQAVQLKSLLEYNGFGAREKIPAGTTVYLQPRNTEAPRSKKEVVVHEVQPKEGLYAISRKYQVPVQEIRSLNRLESDKLSIGQKLVISK